MSCTQSPSSLKVAETARIGSTVIVDATFLFSDIEGSTRLWEEHPDEMRLALARHDDIMRGAIEARGGEVFKTIGDAFCAAFETAEAAVAAASDAQTALQREPWPGGLQLRVRMAINSGQAERRDGDYFGQPLNRVARLMGVASGAQVLVSAAAQALVGSGAALVDLGEHRLRDLQRAEPVYQLAADGLESSFPPLRTIEFFPNNLPQHLASFVGRDVELATIREMIQSGRLVTLLGAGGAGKTRIAIQAAADLLESFADGAWLVELAGLTDPNRLEDVVADTLGVRQTAGRSRSVELQEHLRERRLLIVLDNCEHLIDACARFVDRVGRMMPSVSILSTSRSPLGIPGEATYRVPSLRLPPSGIAKPNELLPFEAVRLFVDRASLVSPGFALTNENAADVAELVRRLDGIPLAIELAAARIRVLSPAGILERLQDRFRLLTGGNRAGLPRHQTLQALIDWSHDLLDADQRTVLRRLAVFRGGWALEEAEAIVCDDAIEAWQVLDIVTALVDRSLVVYDADGRYRILETVREYANDRLVEAGEQDEVRERHARVYLSLAELAETFFQGPDAARWMDRLEPERENLRLALETLVGTGDAKAALRLAGALLWFWDVRAYWREGSELLDKALAAYGDGPPCAEVAAALRTKGMLAMAFGELDLAEETFRRNVAVAREIGDRLQVARAIHNRALVRSRRGRGLSTIPMFEESLLLFRELGDGSGQTRALLNIALVLNDAGESARSEELYTEALEVARRIQDDRVIANCLNNLGAIAHEAERYDEARSWHTESLAVRELLGDRQGIAISHHNLGLTEMASGMLDAAYEWLELALNARIEMQERTGIVESIEGLACLASVAGDFARAAMLFGGAEAARIELDRPMQGTDLRDYERYRAHVEAALGPHFESMLKEGADLSWNALVEVAARLAARA